MIKSVEPSVARELVGARRATVNFRTKWKRAFENAGAKRLSFGREPDLRSVFALPDDHQLLEQFEHACVGHRTNIDHVLNSVERRRAPEMWVPTLVRGCKQVRVVESEPIQQEKLLLQQARAFARKYGVEELRKDWLYVIRRHASTPELLIEIEGGGEKRWRVNPFTEWAVVGCAVPITTIGPRLRPKKWKGTAQCPIQE
jgi:hypothetical protein